MSKRVGQQLGNYTLLQLLGRGGFADVYLGEHIYLKSQAAIKVLQTRLSDSSDIDGFLQEAQMIARLSHPNVIRVLDFGMAQETPYLVMEYAPNGTLRARHVRGLPVPLMPVLLYGLAGFVPGLTMLGKRKYPSIGSVLRAFLLSLLLFAVAMGWILYKASLIQAFPIVMFIILINLLIALILLIVYSVIIRLIDPA